MYITPTFASAQIVADAGADIIAVDCTRRRLAEQEPWPEIVELSAIHGTFCRSDEQPLTLAGDATR